MEKLGTIKEHDVFEKELGSPLIGSPYRCTICNKGSYREEVMSGHL